MFCCFCRVLDERETPIDVLWNDTLIFYSGYTYQALEPIVGKFCSLLNGSSIIEMIEAGAAHEWQCRMFCPARRARIREHL